MDEFNAEEHIKAWVKAGYTLDEAEKLNIVSKINNVDNINPISLEDMSIALQIAMDKYNQ